METYAGSCHCGAVRFAVMSDLAEATTCDCSLCTMRGALMVKVHESALTLLEGEDDLALYQWNMRRARHHFCKVCGTYVFHRKRAAPDHYGVNVHCLEGVDPAAIPVRATEGANMTVVAEGARSQWPGPRIAREGVTGEECA